MEHPLKTWPPYFQEVYHGRKNYEVRENDRDFRPFDILRLREWVPAAYEAERSRLLLTGMSKAHAHEEAEKGAYTGRECRRMVGFMIYGGDPVITSSLEAIHAGINAGYVVMSLCSTIEDGDAKRAAWEATRPEGQVMGRSGSALAGRKGTR